MNDAKTLALEVLNIEADPKVLKDIEKAEANGAVWIFDPHFPNVVGLVKSPGSDEAIGIVYIDDHDFEGFSFPPTH